MLCFVYCNIYCSFAIIGYRMFGEATLTQITLNLPKHTFLAKLALWITVINYFTKYALLLNPLARGIEELLPEGVSSTLLSSIALRNARPFNSVLLFYYHFLLL